MTPDMLTSVEPTSTFRSMGDGVWNVGKGQKEVLCTSGWLGPVVWKLLVSQGLILWQKWEVLLVWAESKCGHLNVVLLGRPKFIPSFLMCVCSFPQASVMCFLAAHRWMYINKLLSSSHTGFWKNVIRQLLKSKPCVKYEVYVKDIYEWKCRHLCC
jgi:hypothetical protein